MICISITRNIVVFFGLFVFFALSPPQVIIFSFFLQIIFLFVNLKSNLIESYDVPFAMLMNRLQWIAVKFENVY